MMNDLPATQGIPELQALMEQQQTTGADMRQCVGQLAQLMVAFKGQLDDMRKDLMYRVTVTNAQARSLREAVQARATALCGKNGLPYTACGRAVREAIRRELYREFAVSSFHDLPAFQYESAADFILCWNSLSLIRKLRERSGG